MSVDFAKLGFKCGLEIHQQLATTKLFCRCSTQDPPADAGNPDFVFRRRLRPTQSELGEVDAAALMEARRNREFEYRGWHGRACLVDADEEPPEPASEAALDAALSMTLLLGATPIDEVQWMRKIVIDGSNTTGFQRTGLVALGGLVEDVPVQSLCLEEDSCQRLGETQDVVQWSLDRLGIPLIEIATAPTIRDGAHARTVAARLGALLRSTGRVKRGLGTIRQDLNVSIAGGARIEVKGVQELNAIPRVIEWEVRRQVRLVEVAKELAKRGAGKDATKGPVVDLAMTLAASGSNVVKKTLSDGGQVLGVRLPGFHGLLGSPKKEDPRLGRELSAYAKREAGVAGILHGDELPGLGITEADVAAIRKALGCGPQDSFAIVAAPKSRAPAAIQVVLERARRAFDGVPEEVRAAEPDDTTTYLRPLPGAARMYPETDVPPVPVRSERLDRLRAALPPPPEKVRARLTKSYGISDEEAKQIVDAGQEAEFEAWAAVADGPLASRALLALLPDLRRRFPGSTGLEDHVPGVLAAIRAGRFAKEALALILEEIAAGRAKDAEAAAARLGLSGVPEEALRERARELVQERAEFVRSRGKESVGPLMGVLMKEFRGKVDGGVVSRTLEVEVEKFLQAQVRA